MTPTTSMKRKAPPHHPLLSGLVLAVAAAVYGQDGATATAPAATAGTTNAGGSTPAATAAADAPATTHKPLFSFEGTDLRVGKLPPISFHGFASQGFLASSTYNYLGNSSHGSFEFSEFGLNASASPFARTRIAAQAFVFDIGNVGNYEPVLDYGLVDYTFADEFGLRAGRVRRPDGIYNHIQDVDLARTFVLLPQGLYDARWRDFSASIDGGSAYGNVSLGKAGSLSYEAYGGIMNLSQEGGIARRIQNDLPAIARFDSVEGNIITGGQLWYNTPIQGLRAGASLGQAIDVTYDFQVLTPLGALPYHVEIETTFQHYSLEYLWRSWTFQAEYRTLNQCFHRYRAGGLESRPRQREDQWFAAVAYRFNRWLEAGAYYTEFYDDISDRGGATFAAASDAFQKDVALSFRFDPKPWWIVKLEGHYLRGTALLRDDGRNPVRDDDGWLMLALKTTFSF